MITLFNFKIIAAIAIFSAAFFAGLLPAQFDDKNTKRRFLTEAVASGIFIGAAIFHILPDAERGFTQLNVNYLMAIFLCIIGFIMLVLIEQSSIKLNNTVNRSKITGLLLAISLSIHSLIEGAALGINMTIAGAFVIFVAIIVHKSLACFALIVSLRRANFTKKRVMGILVLFSLMTPLGIFLASIIGNTLQQDTSLMAEAVLNAVTAGSFIYIGTLDTVGKQLKSRRLIERAREFSGFLAGLIMMGIVNL